MPLGQDLVVFSHLRWDGVWQRPQHLLTRVARHHQRTWFVEEPRPAEVGAPRLVCEEAGAVTRVMLEVPASTPPGNGAWLTFGDSAGADHGALIAELVASPSVEMAWLYTPLALPLARQLSPGALVYDVMDDLSAFAGASAEMKLRQAQALAEADVVFTGGRSLHESILDRRHRPGHTYCFPSGVEIEHFKVARTPHARPVAGYVGVIDERLDLGLLAELAASLPDWTIQLVGPVTKIDKASLPTATNIQYVGKKPYQDMPAVLSGFDVALMPFALNEATRAISPTKTLEYLAAGLPVVSTRIRDVVRDCGELVILADDAGGFAAACRAALTGDGVPSQVSIDAFLQPRRWDVIAEQMVQAIRAAQPRRAAMDEVSA